MNTITPVLTAFETLVPGSEFVQVKLRQRFPGADIRVSVEEIDGGETFRISFYDGFSLVRESINVPLWMDTDSMIGQLENEFEMAIDHWCGDLDDEDLLVD